jgi:iron complex transport system substrate-binding protein
MKRRTTLLAAALSAAALTLGACADDASNKPAANATPDSAAFPVTVGDVTLDKRPERIISLAPVMTEILFAVGAGEQVVAVDDQSNYPPDAPKSDLSGYTPNAEAIAAYTPDLVLLTYDPNNIVQQLTELKIPVYLADAPKNLDDTYRQISDVGKLTGHADEADDLVQQMKDDIAKLLADLPERTEKLTYYHEVDPNYYTVTSKTFLGSLYAMVGLENIADPADADGSAGGYPQLSQEAIIKADPDFIFLADTKCCQQSPETVKARPGWNTLSAVKNNRVVVLDDDIASRWGPRVVDLLRVIVGEVSKVPA